MKKAIIQTYKHILCPHCRECRSMMMLIKKGKLVGFHADYADEGDTIVCATCDKDFIL